MFASALADVFTCQSNTEAAVEAIEANVPTPYINATLVAIMSDLDALDLAGTIVNLRSVRDSLNSTNWPDLIAVHNLLQRIIVCSHTPFRFALLCC